MKDGIALDRLWRLVVEPSGTGELASLETDRQTGSKFIRVAIDSDGRRHLLVPTKEEVRADTHSQGVVLVPHRLVIEGKAELFADLVCVDTSLEAAFTELCEDACRRIETATEPPASTLSEVLQEWRNLLRRGQGDIDRSAVIGLRGELEIVRQLAENSPTGALAAWRGPLGGTFDFQRDDLTVEVKTSTAQDGRAVTIHGLRQLDPPEEHRFHLAFVRLQADDLGESCPMIVKDLRTLGVDGEELDDLLAGVSYLDGDESSWSERFSTLELDLWYVGTSFPGLRSSRMDPEETRGLSNISYTLDLDSAGKPLAVDEELAIMKALTGSQ